jgi:two-component system, NarL family, response regulator DegU
MTEHDQQTSRPGRRLRVLVVDADHRVRESLAGLIELADCFEVVGATGLPVEAVETVRNRAPDIVLLDPRLPELDVGLSLVLALRALRPEIVLLVMGWSNAMENAALASGADGFLDKCADPGSLLEAVSTAAARADEMTYPEALVAPES